ncbi:MAG TPA: DUF5313 family protein [Mycobacteriales bacterium]
MHELTEGQPVRRPDPLRWAWYGLGGRLPERYNSWILSDATRPRWMARHAVRALVQLAIPVGLVLLLPGPVSIRLVAVAGGLVLGLFFALVYSTETVEHRVRRAGFPPGTAEAVRAGIARDREAADSARRREANARRAARRR